MAVRRIVAYAGGDDIAASREFYVEVLGMRVAMEDPVLDLQSPDDPAAEVIIGAQEMQDANPSLGVDVGEPAAVDAAHAEAVRRGLRVVDPLTDEPWAFAASSSKPWWHDRQRARAHHLTTAPSPRLRAARRSSHRRRNRRSGRVTTRVAGRGARRARGSCRSRGRRRPWGA